MPPGIDERALIEFLQSIRVNGGPDAEFAGYLDREFRRFVFTWSLCADLKGRCLEVGAAPYFMTAILKAFADVELTLSNYSQGPEKTETHIVQWRPPGSEALTSHHFTHDIFNVEFDRLPYPDDSFDSVLLCEVLEHLTADPMAALVELRRVLKPGGRLILTTPNAACLRNVLRMLVGKSVTDRYSAYGPYGRHNREYTRDEVVSLLEASGFAVARVFTANVIFQRKRHLLANALGEALFMLFAPRRARALGQYSFVSAEKRAGGKLRRPDWLYRSYADADMAFD